MRPFTSTISLDEARPRLGAAVRPVARTEMIGLAEAAGRVVAADMASPTDVPAFARADRLAAKVASAMIFSAGGMRSVAVTMVSAPSTRRCPVEALRNILGER